MIIIHSSHTLFHESLEKVALENQVEFLHAFDDDTCIDLARQHPDAMVVVDAHSLKPYIDCRSLRVVKKIKDSGLPNHALMLSWVSRYYILHHTSQNFDNNPCMGSIYKDNQYLFEELPIDKDKLLAIITSKTKQNE